MIKRVINATKESKRVDFSYGRLAAYHNGGSTGVNGAPFFTLNGTGQMPSQGDGDSNRDGNDIYGIGWTARLQFNVPADRLNTKFRCMVLRCTRGYSLTGAYANIFDNVTQNAMIDPVDKDRVQVVKTFWVSPGKSLNPGVPAAGKEVTYYRKIFIPCKKVIRFYDDGSQDNSQIYDYYIGVWAYDTWGSLSADIVGYVQCWSRFTFKE